MAKPRQLSSYREYCTPGCERRLAGPVNSPSQVKSALNKIYKVTKSLESKVNLLHNLLMAESTYLQIKRRKYIPANITTRVLSSRKKIESTAMCIAAQKAVIEDYYTTIDNAVCQARHALTSINTITEAANVFFPLTKGKRSEKAAIIRDLVTLAYGQIIDINAYIEKAIDSESKKEDAPAETAYKEDTLGLGMFVEQLRGRGWKTPEDKPETEALFDGSEDGFSLSNRLIQLVKLPVEHLLPKDQLVGLITFPVILQPRNKLTDQAIRVCNSTGVGYSIYVVYGSYLVVEQMVSIGIHKSLMKTEKDKKELVDTDKFTALLPYTKKEFPAWADKLSVLYPSQPAKLRGQHYYCPLVPRELSGNNRISIQDWSFLQQ